MICQKRVFSSFKTAENVALEESLQNKEIGHPELKPYKCQNCGKWHLTSRKKGISKAEKKNLTKEREFILRETEHYINKYERH